MRSAVFSHRLSYITRNGTLSLAVRLTSGLPWLKHSTAPTPSTANVPMTMPAIASADSPLEGGAAGGDGAAGGLDGGSGPLGTPRLVWPMSGAVATAGGDGGGGDGGGAGGNGGGSET